jgi:hypothetical protein
MLATFARLLRSSKPLLVVTCLVAVLGITGSAYGARLITGRDVKDGSLTAADLSKAAKTAVRGARGAQGLKGAAGAGGKQGLVGAFGQTGAQGPIGLTGPQGATGGIGAASTVVGPRGLTGDTGADSVVAGPQGPIGPGGTTQGAVCTVPGGLHGTINWTSLTASTWSMQCVGVS